MIQFLKAWLEDKEFPQALSWISLEDWNKDKSEGGFSYLFHF